jgi:hypothetical protein
MCRCFWDRGVTLRIEGRRGVVVDGLGVLWMERRWWVDTGSLYWS